MRHYAKPDSEAIRKSIDDGARFSKIFFDAFKIEEERANQWRFLALLLQKEKNLRIILDDLDQKNNRIFWDFLNDVGGRTPMYTFKKLVSGFNTESAALMQLEVGKKKGRALLLTKEFVKAATTYIQLFITLIADGKLAFDANDPTAVMQHFKALIRIQFDEYYPLWAGFINAVSNKKVATAFSAEKVRDKLTSLAPSWAILMTAWQYHLGAPKRLNRSGIYSAVFHTMEGADIEEIEECLSFLSKQEGPRLLLPKKIDGKDWFLPNTEIYESEFESYTQALKNFKTQLIGKLRDSMKDAQAANKRQRKLR